MIPNNTPIQGETTPTLSLSALRDLLEALEPELAELSGLTQLWFHELRRELQEMLDGTSHI